MFLIACPLCSIAFVHLHVDVANINYYVQGLRHLRFVELRIDWSLEEWSILGVETCSIRNIEKWFVFISSIRSVNACSINVEIEKWSLRGIDIWSVFPSSVCESKNITLLRHTLAFLACKSTSSRADPSLQQQSMPKPLSPCIKRFRGNVFRQRMSHLKVCLYASSMYRSHAAPTPLDCKSSFFDSQRPIHLQVSHYSYRMYRTPQVPAQHDLKISIRPFREATIGACKFGGNNGAACVYEPKEETWTGIGGRLSANDSSATCVGCFSEDGWNYDVGVLKKRFLQSISGIAQFTFTRWVMRRSDESTVIQELRNICVCCILWQGQTGINCLPRSVSEGELVQSPVSSGAKFVSVDWFYDLIRPLGQLMLFRMCSFLLHLKSCTDLCRRVWKEVQSCLWVGLILWFRCWACFRVFKHMYKQEMLSYLPHMTLSCENCRWTSAMVFRDVQKNDALSHLQMHPQLCVSAIFGHHLLPRLSFRDRCYECYPSFGEVIPVVMHTFFHSQL